MAELELTKFLRMFNTLLGQLLGRTVAKIRRSIRVGTSSVRELRSINKCRTYAGVKCSHTELRLYLH